MHKKKSFFKCFVFEIFIYIFLYTYITFYNFSLPFDVVKMNNDQRINISIDVFYFYFHLSLSHIIVYCCWEGCKTSCSDDASFHSCSQTNNSTSYSTSIRSIPPVRFASALKSQRLSELIYWSGYIKIQFQMSRFKWFSSFKKIITHEVPFRLYTLRLKRPCQSLQNSLHSHALLFASLGKLRGPSVVSPRLE